MTGPDRGKRRSVTGPLPAEVDWSHACRVVANPAALTMARRKKVPIEVARGKLRRSEHWAGLSKGDPVTIEASGLASATWTFLAHVANTETGDESVEVVGGKTGERMVRSFRPTQVFPYRPRRKKGVPQASLADAPQLPLS
jgi:hypothetical protein